MTARKSTTTIDAVTDARLTVIEGQLAQLVALVTASTPVKVTATKAPKARKGSKAPKAPATLRCLTQKVRKEFITDAGWGTGMSTRAIASEVVNGRQQIPNGWQIGPRNTARVAE